MLATKQDSKIHGLMFKVTFCLYPSQIPTSEANDIQ